MPDHDTLLLTAKLGGEPLRWADRLVVSRPMFEELHRQCAERGRQLALDQAPNTYLGIRVVISENIDGWALLDREGNVLAAGEA
jgi:hypothetical protein